MDQQSAHIKLKTGTTGTTFFLVLELQVQVKVKKHTI